jgi:hypothetical protein
MELAGREREHLLNSVRFKPDTNVVIKPKAADTKIKVEFFMATNSIKEINTYKSID